MIEKNTKKNDFNLTKLDRLSSKSNRNKPILKHAVNEENRRSSFIFIENNTIMISFLSVLFFPYILGMLLSLIVFYFYVGISITDFFHVYSGVSQFIFWVLGFYVIITVIDIWLLSQRFFYKTR